MRGLDGKLTENVPSNQQPGSPETSSRSSRGSAPAPHVTASGRSQVDYLSRLVDRLVEDTRRDVGDLKFIGILGTDVYDKILLMRAIRPIAPQAVFFTTDMDARLIDQSEFRYTHNLLIASHYGLMLDHNMSREGQIPPFRDAYQTSLCRGCLHALGDVGFLEPGPDGMSFEHRPAPVLYELGRYGPYRLIEPDEDRSLSGAKDIAGWFGGGSHRARVFGAGALVLLFVALLRPSYWAARVRLLLGYRARRGHRPADEAERRYPMRWIGLTSLGLFLGLFALVVADAQSRDHEPFTIFDGISTWPTEFIRLFVCVISAYATFAIMRSSDRNARTITQRFELHHDEGSAGDGSSRGAARHRAPWYAGWLNADRLWGWEQSRKPIEGVALWSDYLRDGSLGARMRRTLPFVVVYIAFSGIIVSLMGRQPNAPVRGLLNQTIDRMLLWAGVIALIWLLYFVFDATRLCDHLINLLRREGPDARIRWPEGLRHAAAYRQGLDGPGLESDSLAHLIAVRIIEARTEAVDKFIYYPSVAILLMILSRYHVFDNWDWPVSLMLVYCISSAMMVYCALAMRRNAEGLRARALEQMHGELGKVRAAGCPPEMVTEEQIQTMIHEVESADRGAFCRIADNPIIRAVLIPFGGVGTLAVLDQLRPYL